MGIVKLPLPTVLATELPETVPSSAEVNTATLAGPPRCLPATALPRSMKNRPMPVFSRNAPNMMKRNMNVDDTPSGMPSMPSVVKNMWVVRRSKDAPRCLRKPGIRLPKYAYVRHTQSIMTMGKPTTRRAASSTSRMATAPTAMSSGVYAPARSMRS